MDAGAQTPVKNCPARTTEAGKISAPKQPRRDGSQAGKPKAELHEMLVPAAIKVPWSSSDASLCLHSYLVRLVPIPADRRYREFGLFVKKPLPGEAEDMEVDLHLQQGRIVKAGLVPSGVIAFDRDEIVLVEKFQEMWLKIILDRSEFFLDFVQLGGNDLSSTQVSSSTFYLLLPVSHGRCGGHMTVDWKTVMCCLSSPIFRCPKDSVDRSVFLTAHETLELADGPVGVDVILNSLVFTPHDNTFYFVDGIHPRKSFKSKKCKSRLLYPKQPLLKAENLLYLGNLLYNRFQANEEVEICEKEEHFSMLPPELCSLKIIGFSKDIGSSLFLLPSIMHRLESLLVAIELKDMLSIYFPEGSEITTIRVLEALTTDKCSECLSLERLEVLGDAFLKYIVGRHNFLSYETLDEGQLTMKRSNIVNNSHLYALAIKNNLQVYICDEPFKPSQFFALSRPCKILCNKDKEFTIHFQRKSNTGIDGANPCDVKCNKFHHWLYQKTVADVVEALVGAFLVDCGFEAAIAFLEWIGIQVNFEVSHVYKIWEESKSNLSLVDSIDITSLEHLLGYNFHHKGLLHRAFTHPSYKKHSGGCYQRLEFLGDAVLDYLITSFLYSAYPDLKPGQLTDLRSIAINNKSLANIAVRQSLHSFLIKDCRDLTEAINKFENFIYMPDSEKDVLDEPACPKVLGDMVESCFGAILLDTGFDLKCVWRTMLTLLDPVLSFTTLQINPIRELWELCQFCEFKQYQEKGGGPYLVEVEVDVNDRHLTCSAINPNSNVAGRMAAQKALTELKAFGYKSKCKSLDDIMQSTQKKQAELIGFDERPIVAGSINTFRKKLQVEKSKVAPKSKSKVTPKSKLRPQMAQEVSSHVSKSAPSIKVSNGSKHRKKPLGGNTSSETTEASIHVNGLKTSGDFAKGFARSQLFEVCAANHWNPPLFVCVEEGSSNRNMVIVKVEAGITTDLECFSEPKPKKNAAQDHAAEGVLWYLRHRGYLPK